MGVLSWIFLIIVISILGDTIVKAVRAGRSGPSGKELEALKRQIEDQSAALEDTRAALAGQDAQIEDLQERLEFTERMLLQVRERPELDAGPSA